MSKKRVYEFAKEKNVPSKKVIEMLERLGQPVSSHMAVIGENEIKQLEQQLGAEKPNTNQKATPKQNRPSNPASKGNQNGGSKEGQRSHSHQSSNSSNHTQRQGASPNNRGNRPSANSNEKVSPERSRRPQANNTNNNGDANAKNKSRNNDPRNRNNKRSDNGHFGNRSGKRNNRRNRQDNRGPKPKQQTPLPEKITIPDSLAVSELAEKLGRESTEIIKKLMALGVMATKNQQLDKDTIELIADDYGVKIEEEVFIDETAFEDEGLDIDEETAVGRPPVVTIMGHVDHGKTTLLDSIRHTKVTDAEAGGITQHIGAYQITHEGKKITFLDTPGHAAFTTMRARGAKITDITVLVVAADDGVMPQTIEAINHAKAAEVPIIVAVNKMDKEGANPDRVMQELTEHGLIPEDWGGDTIFVKLSALQGEGIDDLLEMITLVAEVEDYKANPDKAARGSVIEAELDKGRGPVATLLVQNGTLNIGDAIVVGNTYGRVRAMVNELGRRVKQAGPSTPVEITGLNDVPNAGDMFIVYEDEKKARQIGEARAEKNRVAERKETSKVSLDDLFEKIKEGDMKEINVIVKADVQGSAEAVSGSLQKIDVEGVRVNIIHTGVGAITESDIILASASNAIIIGFNVRPDGNAKRTAEVEKVDIRLYRVIYNAIEEMEAAMKGMLDPEYEEKVIGQVEVRTTFKVSKVGTIAGCYVTDGKVSREAGIRLIRDGIVIYEGKVDTLKRFKDDAKEVSAGYECGITLENFNDIKEGDTMEAWIMEEVSR
ncbi:translation initiation factor IF-2 [Pullulanibacillus pueri]|uniref:Translation initiation factor IF-2 n=1 Tax=Pullulanibacillus pueri TaxID=1437324 RepID=A0A8J2ZWE1_9BACL|nr:translation initiation factor IF-2 [Pullulanibacillus pueri]MBM7682518.1 translation initiation factor IF-2 [Pullulanibacillus pueri]GGH82081.1 translation initiation factor IF-2 [Pullulanibacillus pueri]